MILSNLLLFSTPPPPSSPTPNLNPNPNPNFPSRFRCRCRRSGDSQWDSNAESYRFRFRDEEIDGDEFGKSRRSSGRRWWSDETEDEFDDEFDPFDDGREDFWDKIWIFKVFKAYGYMLPAIIGSLLLATGPKAFLMALALPLGQSAISLAIEKLWGRRVPEGPRTRPKTKRKPFAKSSSDFRKQEKEERSNAGRGRGGYRSWVSTDSGVADRRGSSGRSSFGGWDELDSQTGPMERESLKDESVKEEKLSKRGKYRDAPLFLRLLIAVFPFLGSWTRIL